MNIAIQTLSPAAAWTGSQRGRATPDNSVRSTPVAVTSAMLALLLPTVLASGMDERTLNGANLWLKPIHFEFALAINFATLALLLPMLSPAWQTSRALRWSLQAAGFSALLEIFWILSEAALGRASHFNVATPLEVLLYPLAGIGSLLIVWSSGVFGYALWRSPLRPGANHLRRGAAIGLILGSVVTVVVAGFMSAGHSHLVGGPQTDAFGLPFLGWATRGGDLRVPHFFATHAIQALPIAGLLADRLIGTRATWLMPMVATVYFSAVFGLFVQALMGIPLIRL